MYKSLQIKVKKLLVTRDQGRGTSQLKVNSDGERGRGGEGEMRDEY